MCDGHIQSVCCHEAGLSRSGGVGRISVGTMCFGVPHLFRCGRSNKSHLDSEEHKKQNWEQKMSDAIGTVFTVTTFGESHCAEVGTVVDGCPPRLPLQNRQETLKGQFTRFRPSSPRVRWEAGHGSSVSQSCPGKSDCGRILRFLAPFPRQQLFNTSTSLAPLKSPNGIAIRLLCARPLWLFALTLPEFGSFNGYPPPNFLCSGLLCPPLNSFNFRAERFPRKTKPLSTN